MKINKRNKQIIGLFFGLISVVTKAQIGTLIDSDRSYIKLSLAQAINLGKPALQIGFEKGIKPKTTLSAELGWIMNYGFKNVPTDRSDGRGVQLFTEIRHYPFGLSSNDVKIYFGLGAMFRVYNFNADMWAGMGIPENGSYYDAKFYQNFTNIKYKTNTTALNVNIGCQTSISNTVIFDFAFGFGPRYHHVQHSLNHKLKFIIDDFKSPFVTPSNKGNYMRAGMLLQASIGFKLD